MIVPAVIYLAALAAIFGGLLITPDHTVKGYGASISFMVLFAAGVILAVNAL